MNAYDRAVAEIRDMRRAVVDDGQIAWQNALRENDGLYAAFKAYQADMIAAATGNANTIDATRAALDTAMKNAGFDKSVLDPPYSCEACKDTGRVGGKYCRCVIRRVINSDRENLVLAPADFEKACESAPGPAIKKAYAAARKYLDEALVKPFFILTGAPGTGKTVLARAIAGRALSDGRSAVTVTAFDFVRRALDYHTQFSVPDYIDRFTPMLDCDMLVIDDLGTESMLKNVTKEYLFTVINERSVGRKPTVVTTNRTLAELNARYGESIFSRMCDKSLATVISVDAKNERLKSGSKN